MSYQEEEEEEEREEEDKREGYPVQCHCGAMRARFKCPQGNKIIAWDCNCSDCFMRRNVHVIVPESYFTLAMDSGKLEDATILYQWGTHAAIRRFCKTCGILPWYRPRSNPDGIAITINCVDWTNGGMTRAPEIEIRKFDGIHWEETMKKINTGITDMSKACDA